MKLLNSTYGKGRVRVMRLSGEGQNREVRELTVLAMLAGDIAQAYTQADNSTTVSTDTIKNVVNVVAREELEAGPEAFCRAVAKRLLNSYPGMTSAKVSAREVRWNRLMVDGTPHPHAFTLDGNGQGTAEVVMDRDGDRVTSGLSGFTFLKATASGWSNYIKDRYTTLPETEDRILATSMEASWRWSRDPADFAAANAFQTFTLPLTADGETLRCRTFWHGSAAISLDWITLTIDPTRSGRPTATTSAASAERKLPMWPKSQTVGPQ
jgi:urate oxidase